MFHEIESERDLTSIGCLAGQFQIDVRAIERTAAKLNMVPAWRLNSVPYYDGGQVQQLAASLADRVTTRSK